MSDSKKPRYITMSAPYVFDSGKTDEPRPHATVSFDEGELLAALSQLEIDLNAVGFGSVFDEALDLLADFSQLVASESYITAAGRAGESVVFLKPSKRFLELLAALRAVKRDREVVNG